MHHLSVTGSVLWIVVCFVTPFTLLCFSYVYGILHVMLLLLFCRTSIILVGVHFELLVVFLFWELILNCTRPQQEANQHNEPQVVVSTGVTISFCKQEAGKSCRGPKQGGEKPPPPWQESTHALELQQPVSV